jgi:hypothetical protein
VEAEVRAEDQAVQRAEVGAGKPTIEQAQAAVDAVPTKADGAVDMEARQRVLDEWKADPRNAAAAMGLDYGVEIRVGDHAIGGEGTAGRATVGADTTPVKPFAADWTKRDAPDFQTSREYPQNQATAAHEIVHSLFSRNPQTAQTALEALIAQGVPRDQAFESLVDLGGLYLLEPRAITDAAQRRIIGEWLDPHIRTALDKAPLTLRPDGTLSGMAKPEARELVSKGDAPYKLRLIDAADGSFRIEAAPEQIAAARRGELGQSADSDILTEPASADWSDMSREQRHDRLHNTAMAMFGKGFSQITAGQRKSVLARAIGGARKAAASLPLANLIVEGTMPGIINDLTILHSDSPMVKFRKRIAQSTRHIMLYMQTLRSACNILSGNDPKGLLAKVIADPFTAANDKVWESFTSAVSRINTAMDKAGNSYEQIFRPRIVADRRVSGSQLAYYYVQSNGGADMKEGSRVADIAVANGLARTEAEALVIVKQFVDAAKADADIVEFIKVTQEVMRDIFTTQAAPVYKQVTGKIAKPIAGLYATIVNTDDQVTMDDAMSWLASFAGETGYDRMPAQTLKELRRRGGPQGHTVNDDYFGLSIKHIEAMINYSNKAALVKDTLGALTSQVVADDYRQKFGNLEYLETLKKLVVREMSARGQLRPMRAPGDSVIRFFNGNAAKVFLSWNIGPLMNQFVSVPLFMATSPARMVAPYIMNMASLMAQIATHKGIRNSDAFKLVEKYSPGMLQLLPNKQMKLMNEVLESKGKMGFHIGSVGFNKFLDAGMMPLQWADMVPRLAAWKTAFDGKLEMLQGTGMTQQAMEQAAKSFADDCINKSFNPSSRQERGLIQSESPELAKSFMLFTSQPFATARWFLSDIALPVLRAMQDGGMAGLGRHLKSNPDLFYKMATGMMLPGLALGALARRRPQRDLEEFLKDAICLGFLNTIPIVGQMVWWNATMGYGKGADMAGVVGRFTDEMMAVLSDVAKWDMDFRTVRSAERSIELVLRVPDYPVRILHNLYEKLAIKGETDLDVTYLRDLLLGKQSPYNPNKEK